VGIRVLGLEGLSNVSQIH